MLNESTNTNEEKRGGEKVTIIGSLVNLVLSAIKLTAGILAHSQAMIADSVHSLSDLGTDAAVLFGLYWASKPKDESHNYGHGKIETLMTLVISLSLFSVGCGIAWGGFRNIYSFIQGESLVGPGLPALGAAILSVLVKEILFRYTYKVGVCIDSSSVRANAYHHRSDAFSSLGAGMGIAGAIFLGEKWAVLDPLAALIVSFFLLKEAIHIGREALEELLEKSLDSEDRVRILEAVNSVNEAMAPHNLHTRKVGNLKVIEIHIRVEGELSVKKGHDIAHQVENRISLLFSDERVHVNVHVEPLEKFIPSV